MWGDKGGSAPAGLTPLPTPNGQKIMEKYLVNMYSLYKRTNGHTFWTKSFSKVLNENVVKHAKQANKEVGYKYVGRFKDTHGNYYTQYARVSKELSNSECKVIYMVTITKLK